MHEQIEDSGNTVPQSMRMLGYEKAVEVVSHHMKKDTDPKMTQLVREHLAKMEVSSQTPGATDADEWGKLMTEVIMTTLLLSSVEDAMAESVNRIALAMGPSVVLIEPLLYVLKGIQRMLEKREFATVNEVLEEAHAYAKEIEEARAEEAVKETPVALYTGSGELH